MEVEKMTRPPASDAGPKDNSDEALVARCVADDQGAWHTLVARHQPHMLALTRCLLGRAALRELVEDIVENVWYSLLKRDRRGLRAFDPQRASLATYLSVLTRRQVQRQRRMAARQLVVYLGARMDVVDPRGEELDWELFLAEFLPLLSPCEGSFMHERLLPATSTDPSRAVSDAYARKLRERVLVKLLRYLGIQVARRKRPQQDKDSEKK
jgi:DNA-directed RNA polymerase specialized sigma24 family protein